MTERDRQISEIIAEERSRLRNFIRRRVPDPRDAEDILQDVFYELVEANRLLMPIEHVTGWLFRVARNRITDLFRKKRPEGFNPKSFGDAAVEGEGGDVLPEEQRQAFVGHEFEGRSFKEMAAESGVNVNTLLSRKQAAVVYLRERLQSIYDELRKA